MVLFTVRSSLTRGGFLLLMPMLWSQAGVTFAQEASSSDTSPKSAQSATESLEEVRITAQRVTDVSLREPDSTASRLDISVLDTPGSIQVISGDAIRLRGDTDVNDAVTRAVGITTNATLGNGGGGLVARGFAGVGSVMMLYDGIQMPVAANTVTFPYDTWTIDRIEALNGPASVLYGTGAIGGVVNVVSRKPMDDSEGSARFAAGSFNSYQAALDTTGPLADRVEYRFDVDRLSSSGYLWDGQSSSTAFSAALKFAATDALRFTLTDDYGDQRPTVYSGLPLINGVAEESLRDASYTTYGSDVFLKDNWTQFKTDWTPAENITFSDDAYYQVSHRLWRGQNVVFNYVPARDEFSETGFYQVVQHLTQVGDHAQLTWKQPVFGFDNTLAGGGDFNHIEFDRNYYSIPSATEYVDPGAGNRGTFPQGAPAPQHYAAAANLYDLFAEDRLELTRALSLVGGLRFDHQYATREDLIADVTSTAEFNPVSWRIGAVYTLIPGFNAYAQYATATDSVGNLVSLSTIQQSYALSVGKQLEVGLKQVTWNDRLEWTVAAYHIIKNNLLTPDPLNVNLSLQVGQQSSRGLEASAILDLGGRVHLEANGTTLKAQYDQFSTTVSGKVASLDGERPVAVPDQSANLWLVWTATAAWELQVGLRYVGDRFANVQNTVALPAYTVTDAGVRWTPAAKWAIDVHVNNLTNKFYASNYLNNGDYEWIVGQPRFYVVTLTRAF
jgi:iron complex outermembrane receptor protein